jgi:hypothetical protein
MTLASFIELTKEEEEEEVVLSHEWKRATTLSFRAVKLDGTALSINANANAR